MKAYVVNVICSQLEEMIEHTSEIFLDLDKAREFCLNKESEWLRSNDYLIGDSPDVTDEQIEEWQRESIVEDFDNEDYIYKHYIYGDGEEKVFELTSNDIEDTGVFIVKEDFRYMNNQCEIGSRVHLVTLSFKKAYDKAKEIRDKAQIEFGQVGYTDKEEIDIDRKIYSYSLEDEYDLKEIIIERHEVM